MIRVGRIGRIHIIGRYHINDAMSVWMDIGNKTNSVVVGVCVAGMWLLPPPVAVRR